MGRTMSLPKVLYACHVNLINLDCVMFCIGSSALNHLPAAFLAGSQYRKSAWYHMHIPSGINAPIGHCSCALLKSS